MYKFRTVMTFPASVAVSMMQDQAAAVQALENASKAKTARYRQQGQAEADEAMATTFRRRAASLYAQSRKALKAGDKAEAMRLKIVARANHASAWRLSAQAEKAQQGLNTYGE